jgi:ATP/maltotriose-dependent transcriptional regulator MalT
MTDAIIGDMAVRVSSPILIGRARELERLRAALDALGEGSATTVIAGEAGVGKTRLVSEFVELAGAQGMTVLIGGCIDLGEGALPYGPVVEALRRLVRQISPEVLEAALGPGRSELARLLPDLGPVTTDAPSDLSIGSAQGRLFELILGLLERLAAMSPVVFVIEDLHWSDRSTRDLIGFLVRNLRTAPVMLVCTYRSDELHRRHPLLPFLAELERTGRVERLELHPFDRRETADQLRAIAGHDLDATLLDSIHTRSGGNAFFAEELLVASGEDGALELPATLREVLVAKLADLPQPTHDFLRIASAAGQRVDPALLAAAVGLDETTLYEALREVVGLQILVPDPKAGTERYVFRHALLQEAIYDDLLPGERTRLHSAFAQTLEGTSGAMRNAKLAYHWYAAHNLPRALEFAVLAGLEAESAYAYSEATAQFDRAIELWDEVPDAATRAGRDLVDLLAEVARVARYHDPARAVAHIQTAIRLLDGRRDPTRSGLLHERLGRYAWVVGQGDLAKDAYRTAVELIPTKPPSEARARALAGLAQILMLGGRYLESLVYAQQAIELARTLGGREIEGHALNTRGLARGAAGEVDEGLEDLSAALALAEAGGEVDDIGRAYANWTWLLELAGRLEEALAKARAGIEAVEPLGLMRFFGTHLLCNITDCLYRLGRWDEAEEAAYRAVEIGPFGINEILVSELLARLDLGRGRFAAAALRLQPLAPLAERAVDIQFIEPVRASLAELALWEGRADDAAVQVDAAIRLIDHSPEMRVGEIYVLGLRANADVAELARARRDADREAAAVAAGMRLLEGINRRHAEVMANRPVFESLSTAWLALCVAEASRLHHQADPDAWMAAVRVWQQLGHPYVVAYAQWREAEARLAARGDRASAARAIRAALATADRLGAEPLARELRSLASRARLTLEPDEPDAVTAPTRPWDGGLDFGLTTREVEVLALVALGRTNRQIAEELFISGNTAGVHVSNILGKLGVAGRGEAAALAYRLGLIEPAARPAP